MKEMARIVLFSQLCQYSTTIY